MEIPVAFFKEQWKWNADGLLGKHSPQGPDCEEAEGPGRYLTVYLCSLASGGEGGQEQLRE